MNERTLVCLECNKTFSNLNVHISRAHMSVVAYKEKHGIPKEVVLLSDEFLKRKCYSPDVAEEFLRRMMKNRTASEVMRDPDMPSDSFIYRYAKGNKDFALRLDKVREQFGFRHNRDYSTEAKAMEGTTVSRQEALDKYLKTRGVEDFTDREVLPEEVAQIYKEIGQPLALVRAAQEVKERAAKEFPNIQVEISLHIESPNVLDIIVSDEDEAYRYGCSDSTPIGVAFREAVTEFFLMQAQKKVDAFLAGLAD